MSPIERSHWERTLTICGTIGIPLIVGAFWLVVNGTRLVDTVDAIGKNQIKTDVRLDLLDLKMDRMNHRIDTLSTHQENVGLFQQRYINGKLTWVPAK